LQIITLLIPAMKKSGSTSYLMLSEWIDQQQSRGLYYFTRENALRTLKINESAFKQAAIRLARKNRVARLLGGFFIIIPLEYAATGVLPSEWFIADLMAYIEQPYYVGLLSAAALHGAAHQQPQQFQVVTTAPLREIKRKKLSIHFFSKKNFSSTPLVKKKVQTGFINLSSPEATAFDLVRYARTIGGMERVLTVVQELSEVIDPAKLVEAAKTDGNLTYAQRLGWLFEKAGSPDMVKKLAQWVAQKHPFVARLEPALPAKGAPRDTRWSLLINASVEGDV